jgi:transposase
VSNYAGIDWATEKHDVLVVDEDGRRVCEQTVSHSEAGLGELCELLTGFDVERVAVERPDGLLVDRLVGAGISVVPIHPNQVSAARSRYTVWGGKSDRFDAFVLAELARTDAHRFRVLCPDSDQTKALKALTRSREALVAQRVATANLLRSELQCFWPAATNLFSSLDSLISLAFIERYPTPKDTRGVGEKRLEGFLRKHKYSGRKTARELLEKIQQSPNANTGDVELAARREIVLGFVETLRSLIKLIKHYEKQITQLVKVHPTGEVFLSFFSTGTLTAATLLAEIGDNRERYMSNSALAADAGMSPVAVESGKRRNAKFRYGCDKRLRKAISVLADTTRHTNPWAKHVYQTARERGKTHPHAIRILGRAWIRILWACWQNQTPYNPEKHRNLRQFQQATPTRG